MYSIAGAFSGLIAVSHCTLILARNVKILKICSTECSKSIRINTKAGSFWYVSLLHPN